MEAKKEVISTTNAPKALGPYSQGIEAGGFIFISGQGAIDPKTNIYSPATIEEETELALKNVKAILESVGAALSDIVKVTVFLSNMDDFPLFNKVYEKFFSESPPARSCIEVSKLPKGFKVEIEAIALRKK